MRSTKPGSAVRRIARSRSALVLVDFQKRLMPAIHDASAVVDEACRLADIARVLAIPIIGTEQNPAGLGPNIEPIRERCAATLAKMHFDGCRDGLVDALRQHANGDIEDVVLAGCEAHVCLLQTALGVIDAGLRVFVVEAACGSRRPADHRLAMRRLERAGATLASTEMLAFEWLESSSDPSFRSVLALVKGGT
ncbi:MAG TPA: isochorismatase family protein [Casimicrobiaceae bacterium]